MKRIFSLLVLLVGVMAVLAACGSKEDASEKKELVIGIDDKFAPLGFRDDKNEIVGFDIDMAKAAAKEMGVEVTFQPIDWSTKESELASGRIDLIWNGYTITKERQEKVLFTKPYLKNAQVIVTLKDSNLTTFNDLTDKKMGVQAQSSALEAFNASDISKKVKNVSEFKDNVLALNDLKAKRVDAVVIDEVVMDYYMTQQKDTFKVMDETLAPEEYGVGIKKGNEALQTKLQKALDAMMKDGTSAEISKKWFGENKVID